MQKQIQLISLAFLLLVPLAGLEAAGNDRFLNGKPFSDLKELIDDPGLDSIIQDILDIDARIVTLETRLGGLPDDLALALQNLKDAIGDNTFDIDEADDDIDDIYEIISDLQGSPDDLVFTGNFTGGSEADDDTQQAWVDFRSKATGPFTSIEIRNPDGNESIKCDNPIHATLLAMALGSTSPSPGSTFLLLPLACVSDSSDPTSPTYWWNVGFSGLPANRGIELNAGSKNIFGVCNSQFAVVRPRFGGPNWGGIIGGVNCNAPTQRMEVILTR